MLGITIILYKFELLNINQDMFTHSMSNVISLPMVSEEMQITVNPREFAMSMILLCVLQRET